jgi:protein transport protein SEC61 subunit gamma-like protein
MYLKKRCPSVSSTTNQKDIIEKAWDLQHDLEARQKRIGKGKYGRVLKMARNPTNEEYAKTAKITGLGIILVGGIGFLIYLLATQVAPYVGELLGLM